MQEQSSFKKSSSQRSCWANTPILRSIKKVSNYCQKKCAFIQACAFPRCVCNMCFWNIAKNFPVALKLQNTNWFDGFFFLPFRWQWSPLFYLVAVHHVNSFVFQRVDPAVSLALPSFLRNHRSHITDQISRITYTEISYIPPRFQKSKEGALETRLAFGIPYPATLGGTPAAVFGWK